jgi:hypothetical protein
MQLAALTGALDVFKWLDEKKLFTLHKVIDAEENSLLMLAARSGQTPVIEYILDHYVEAAHDLLELRNSEYQTAADVAEEAQQYAAAEFLAKRTMIEELRAANRDLLDVVPGVLMDLSTFVHYNALTLKGLALMLHYYAPDNPKLYLAINELELIDAVKVFMQSNETEIVLLLNEASHRSVCKLEKRDGKAYLIILDSTPTKRQEFFDGLAEQLSATFHSAVERPILCVNNTMQQTDKEHCSYFALKNLHKLLKIKNILDMILSSHLVARTTQHEAEVITYRLPATFMSLAQSPDGLTKYIADNPAEATAILRVNKQGDPQDLRAYAEQVREGYGVVTPQIVPDRKDESSVVKKNNSVVYFKEKYLQRTVPTLFTSLGEAERQSKLEKILSERSASRLMVDPMTGGLTTDVSSSGPVGRKPQNG